MRGGFMRGFEQFLLVMVQADELNGKKEKDGEQFGKDLGTVHDIALLDALLMGAPHTIREGSMSVLVNGKEYLISKEQFERMTKKNARERIAGAEPGSPEEIVLPVSFEGPATGEELMRRLIVLETAYDLRDKRLYIPDFPESAFRFREEDASVLIRNLQEANEDLRRKVREYERMLADSASKIAAMQEEEERLNRALAAQKRITVELSVYYAFLLKNSGVLPEGGNDTGNEAMSGIPEFSIIHTPVIADGGIVEEGSFPKPARLDEYHGSDSKEETYVRYKHDEGKEAGRSGEKAASDVRPVFNAGYAPDASLVPDVPAVREKNAHSQAAAVPNKRADYSLLPVMPQQSILIARIDGIIQEEGGGETEFRAIMAPVDGNGRTFVWVTRRNRTYTGASNQPDSYVTIHAEDVTFEAKWKIGGKPVFCLATISKEDGFLIKRRGALSDGTGHVYIERDGVGIHIFPIDLENGSDGLANVGYMIDSGRSISTGDNRLRRNIEFSHGGEHFEVMCRWNGNGELTAAFAD